MGSKIGWILSGVLVLALAGVIVVSKLAPPDASPPTLSISTPGFFEVHEVTISPAAILGGSLPSAPGNAADDYRQAVEVYRAQSDPIDEAFDRRTDISQRKYTPPQPLLDALENIFSHVSAGAAKREMRLSTPQEITVRYANEQASQLFRVGRALSVLAEVHAGAGKPQEEEKVLQAMFVLGWHMEKEHVRATMAHEGLEVQGGAIGLLGDLYAKWEPQTHASQLQAMRQYARALEKVFKDYHDKLFVVWRTVPNPGDVFAVVERDKDRAWRVDSLLVTGAIRYTHAKSTGDQRVAQKLITRFVNDPDPFVKAAATAAGDLTEAGFNQVGNPPAP